MEYIILSPQCQSLCVFRSEVGFFADSIYMGLLSIHSASLCLLVGTFITFTFKVIIDIYVPIAIFLIGVYFFLDLFLLLFFLTKSL